MGRFCDRQPGAVRILRSPRRREAESPPPHREEQLPADEKAHQSVVAIVGLLVIGAAMGSQYGRWSNGALQLKLALVALVAGLLIWHTRRPRLHALDAAVFGVSLIIVWLGLTVAH